MIRLLSHSYWYGSASYSWVTHSFNQRVYDGICAEFEMYIMDDFGNLVLV